MKNVIAIIVIALNFNVLDAKVKAAKNESPFKSFFTLGICISGNNSDLFEKVFVDTTASWACSHYFHNIIITNGTKKDNSRISERALIGQNKKKIFSYFQKTNLESVDVILLGHTNAFSPLIVKLIEELEDELGYSINLRFVYNSGCKNFKDDILLRKKAQTYIGHKGINYGPVFTPLFLEQWYLKLPVWFALATTNKFINQSPYTNADATEIKKFLSGYFNPNLKKNNDPKGFLVGDPYLSF